jgi:hypothetical protein
LNRKIGHGSRPVSGMLFLETMRTLTDTLKRRNLSLSNYPAVALTAVHEGMPVPSVLNLGQPVDPIFVEMAGKEAIKTEEDEAEAKKNRDEAARATKAKAMEEAAKGQSREAAPQGGAQPGPRPEAPRPEWRPGGVVDGRQAPAWRPGCLAAGETSTQKRSGNVPGGMTSVWRRAKRHSGGQFKVPPRRASSERPHSRAFGSPSVCPKDSGACPNGSFSF